MTRTSNRIARRKMKIQNCCTHQRPCEHEIAFRATRSVGQPANIEAVINDISNRTEMFPGHGYSYQGSVTVGRYCQGHGEGNVANDLPPAVPAQLCLTVPRTPHDVIQGITKLGGNVNLAAGDHLPIFFALSHLDCDVVIVKAIIDAGFPVNNVIQLSSKITSLHHAVCMNHELIVHYLFSAKANPNVIDATGCTPLHYAVNGNLFQMVNILYQNGANMDCEDEKSYTPLFYAISRDNIEMVKHLLSLGSDIHLVSGNKKFPLTPLNLAANLCKFKIVRLLLEKGADVNKEVPISCETPIHAAARAKTFDIYEKKVALECIVELLIKYNADLEFRTRDGFTPLQQAIKARNINVAKILIINGSNINSRLRYAEGMEWTTFHIAAKTLDKELIEVCFDYGAKWNIPDKLGIYPIHLVLLAPVITNVVDFEDQSVAPKVVCRIDNSNEEVIKMFWRKGFPYDQTLQTRWSCTSTYQFPQIFIALDKKQKMLFKGIREQQVKMVKKAIELGAEVMSCSIRLPFPVHYIASVGNYEILKLLLIEGVRVNLLNKEDETPLHLAAKGGHINCCLLLLEFGASYNYCSFSGTPLDLAKAHGHTDIEKLLTRIHNYFKCVRKGVVRKIMPDMTLFYAFINCCNKEGLTLLGLAVKHEFSCAAIYQLVMLRYSASKLAMKNE